MVKKVEREMARFAELTLKEKMTMDNILELEDMSIVTSIYESDGLVYVKSINNDEEIVVPFEDYKDEPENTEEENSNDASDL